MMHATSNALSMIKPASLVTGVQKVTESEDLEKPHGLGKPTEGVVTIRQISLPRSLPREAGLRNPNASNDFLSNTKPQNRYFFFFFFFFSFPVRTLPDPPRFTWPQPCPSRPFAQKAPPAQLSPHHLLFIVSPSLKSKKMEGYPLSFHHYRVLIIQGGK
jgi:hypothetical protein